MLPIDSLVSNVEATLTFTLASKLVDITISLQQQQQQGVASSTSAAGTWILGAICLMVLSITSTWQQDRDQVDNNNSSLAAAQDLVSMLNQTLVLAFSRIVLLQIRISTASSTSPLLEYIRRFLEITFVVVVLYAIIKVLPKDPTPPAVGQETAASVASKQIGTLMINMQRTFAETVANIITDPEIRRLIVLWGACILPSIAGVIGRFRSSSYFTGVAVVVPAASKDEEEEELESEKKSEEEEALLWIAGLGMAWVNTAIGFLLPTSSPARTSSTVLWMQVASTLSLAIVSRAIQPLLTGISLLQGYIEWTIATASTAALASTTEMSKLQLVIATGAIYGLFSALYDAAVVSSTANKNKEDGEEEEEEAFYALSASTLMSISVIMFTNSFVSWVVDSIASPSVMSSTSAFNAGIAAVSMCAGVVASKVVVSLLLLQKQQ